MTAMANRRFGCYSPSPNNVYNFDELERQVGRAFDTYSTFISFDSTPAGHSEIRTAALAGHDILLAWQPAKTVGLYFSDILNGKYDAHIDSWLAYLVTFPTLVYIRFAHEMNGSYTQWNPLNAARPTGSHCESTAQFIEVWRYMVGRARIGGGRTGRAVGNIRWLFCPNGSDVPTTTPYPMESFWPGSGFVDVVGFDSYNGLNGHWMTPLQTLSGKTYTAAADAYVRVSRLHPVAEVWVGETGCVDAKDPKDVNPPVYDSHSKAQWWTDLFALQEELPRMTTVCFFNHTGSRNWRFDSSPESFASFRRNFASPHAGPVTTSG
jgi:hypothetical protein